MRSEKEADKINRDEYLEYLLEQYQNLVFSICLKYTYDYFEAEDLAQETFLSAYKNINAFDKENPKAWLCKIATNKCLDHLKSAKRRVIPTTENFFAEIEQTSSLESDILESEMRAQIYQLCTQLKPPYKEVSIDYFYHEMEPIQIADKTGKPLKTIQTQIYRAKAMLKKFYRKEIKE